MSKNGEVEGVVDTVQQDDLEMQDATALKRRAVKVLVRCLHKKGFIKEAEKGEEILLELKRRFQNFAKVRK